MVPYSTMISSKVNLNNTNLFVSAAVHSSRHYDRRTNYNAEQEQTKWPKKGKGAGQEQAVWA